MKKEIIRRKAIRKKIRIARMWGGMMMTEKAMRMMILMRSMSRRTRKGNPEPILNDEQ